MAEPSKFPFTLEDMDEEEVSWRRARGLVRIDNMVRVEPGGVMVFKKYRRLANLYYTFHFRGDDTLLMSYPKSGTIWSLETMWALRNIDRLHTADAGHTWDRTNFIDLVVYVVRNPKDVCFSYFNFMSLVGNMTGELRDFAELFMAGDLPYGPYWEHLRQAWQRREHPNLHIFSYENMKADYPKELRRFRDILQVDVSDEQLASIVEHTSLEKMQAREKKHTIMKYAKEGTFYHSGRVGAWADNAPEDLDAQMDTWIREESSRLGISHFHSTYAPNS